LVDVEDFPRLTKHVEAGPQIVDRHASSSAPRRAEPAARTADRRAAASRRAYPAAAADRRAAAVAPRRAYPAAPGTCIRPSMRLTAPLTPGAAAPRSRRRRARPGRPGG